MKKNLKVIRTDEELKVFTDPYRMRIIETFLHNNKSMTVKQVADELGEVPAKVHYHVKKLLKIELLKLDHIEVINGINAKYYELLYDEFKVELSSGAKSAQFKSQMNYITRMITRILDDFRKDILAREDKFVPENKDKDYEGVISQNSFYLSKEEYDAFTNDYMQLVNRYKDNINNKENRTFYSNIMGIVKKEK
jgi:predicted transcriptional regulator